MADAIFFRSSSDMLRSNCCLIRSMASARDKPPDQLSASSCRDVPYSAATTSNALCRVSHARLDPRRSIASVLSPNGEVPWPVRRNGAAAPSTHASRSRRASRRRVRFRSAVTAVLGGGAGPSPPPIAPTGDGSGDEGLVSAGDNGGEPAIAARAPFPPEPPLSPPRPLPAKGGKGPPAVRGMPGLPRTRGAGDVGAPAAPAPPADAPLPTANPSIGSPGADPSAL
mmetsp:Transcript_985/g.2240  ORF Transcript_985/g.2240 Transcript_985/m.2240 type:complete len:226 (+) Transcript_985:1561-2238(+)